MAKITYEEKANKMMEALNKHKENKPEKKVEEIKKDLDKVIADIEAIDAAAVALSTIGDVESLTNKMVEKKDKKRELEAKLSKATKLKENLEKEEKALKEFYEELNDKKKEIKENISLIKDKKDKVDKEIEALKAIQNKPPEELEKQNDLIAESEKLYADRRELMGELGKINKAIKAIDKEYKFKEEKNEKIEQEKDIQNKEEIISEEKEVNPEEKQDSKEEQDAKVEEPIEDTTNSNNAKKEETPKKEKVTENKEETTPSREEPTPKKEEQQTGKEGNTQGKGTMEYKPIPGVPKPEEKIYKSTLEDGDKNIYSNSYDKALEEYKNMLEVYNEHVVDYADYDYTKYENGEISYSEYEKHALGLAQEYQVMKKAYQAIKERYDIESKKTSEIDSISNEDLEKKLKELDDETTELWQQGVHENTPDEKRYHEALDEIKRIKEELNQRRENPLRGMSLEELEAKKHELYGKIGEQQEPDEYHFRTHEENGMEGHEDEIDKGLREIREEIERRQPKLEKPEEPVNPGMVMEKGNGEKIPEPPQGSNLPEKSGLQIFREQLNKMPDIKDRHTASERVKLASPIGVTAGALLLGNPFVGVPIIAASMVAAPIIKRVTGQKKIEGQIKQQFSEMSEKEFNKMMDYLSEEKIIDLKPNAVILKALHLEMLDRTKAKQEQLQSRFDEIGEQKDKLLQLISSKNISEEERKNANDVLLSLNKESRQIESESAITSDRLNDIQRGKDRVSAAYKGNLKTRFNIFAHRNTSSKKYLPVINGLADAELERDTAAINGDGATTTRADKKMEEIMQENTHTNFLGIQNSIFNTRNKPIRLVSDRQDNTIRTACVLTTGLVAAHNTVSKLNEYEQAQKANEANWNKAQNSINDVKESAKNISKNDVQLANDEQITTAYAEAEHTAIHTNGNVTSTTYRADDLKIQKDGVDFANRNGTINGNKSSEWLKSLAETMKSKVRIARGYGEASKNLHLSPNAADHSFQVGYTSNAEEQLKGGIRLVEKTGEVFEKVENMDNLPAFQKVAKSFLGPIQAGIALVMRGSRERQENREAKNNIKVIETKEENKSDNNKSNDER